ncbi:alpha/beta fold hydrolase [Microbacterium sp. G2-8]|uniref:alpha/beta fold hydrolase n=1 Tax=Microbacterium sp. G2-8 TaxID=2842454 RepID=UPI001C895773|nr:alpha/beta hydrolase [Microbacterium sp. G2-8]
MDPQVVLVHGIRTSATMWRAQIAHLRGRGVDVHAIDLPGHGTRMSERWSIDEAFASLDRTVVRAAERGPVLLFGHSLGGLLSTAYVGRMGTAPPVSALIAGSCTAFPRGAGLRGYRLALRGMQRLPQQGMWFVDRALAAQLPSETRGDFGAGGYAFASEDAALASLEQLDLVRALVRLQRLDPPMWFYTGEWDQLRLNERVFTRLVPRAELVVVPRSTHLVTAMRPRATNAMIDLAIATMTAAANASGSTW